MVINDNEASVRQTTFSLSFGEKAAGIIVAIFTIVFSVGGNYMLTNYRLNEHEAKIVEFQHRLESIENADYERRVSKVETRQDSSDKTIGEMSSKLDVAIAILNRLDRQTDRPAPK